MALVVPLQTVPSQTLAAVLGGQSCSIALYQKSTGLYMDLAVASTVLFTGVPCLQDSLIVRGAYLGFVGNLTVIDTQGDSDPDYTGLGSRWVLFYLSPAEIPS